MSDIYIQGETLQVGKKFDSALIEGLNETFETMKPKIIAATGSSPAPSGWGSPSIELNDELDTIDFSEYIPSINLDSIEIDN